MHAVIRSDHSRSYQSIQTDLSLGTQFIVFGLMLPCSFPGNLKMQFCESYCLDPSFLACFPIQFAM